MLGQSFSKKKKQQQQTGRIYYKPSTEIAVPKEEPNSSSYFVKDFACSPRKKRKTMQMQWSVLVMPVL